MYQGAAICQTTDGKVTICGILRKSFTILLFDAAYISSYAGGNSAAGWFDGTGTQVYFGSPVAVGIDSMTGNVYVGDYDEGTLRVINTLGEFCVDLIK